MSFGDLEKGYGSGPRGGPAPPPYQLSAYTGSSGRDGDQEYMQTHDRVSQYIQQISANTGKLSSLQKLLGTSKDTQDVRDQLHDIAEQTKEILKDANRELKQLSRLDGGTATESQQRRRQQSNLQGKLKVEAERFLTMQRSAQQREREFVASVKKEQTIKQDILARTEDDSNDETRNLVQDDLRRQQLQRVENEIEYTEAIITEREEAIEDIGENIQQIADIMRDLNAMVNEQQGQLDTIEDNVNQTVSHTDGARKEVVIAEQYQRSARAKMCCILMCFVIIITIIVLVVVFKVVL